LEGVAGRKRLVVPHTLRAELLQEPLDKVETVLRHLMHGDQAVVAVATMGVAAVQARRIMIKAGRLAAVVVVAMRTHCWRRLSQ
jgi:hypothetical protein